MTAVTNIITYLIKEIEEVFVVSLTVLQIAFNLEKLKKKNTLNYKFLIIEEH